jgi:hypothetical protein
VQACSGRRPGGGPPGRSATILRVYAHVIYSAKAAAADIFTQAVKAA